MGNVGGNNVHRAGREEVFFPTDHHFKLTLDNIGDLFVDVEVFGRNTAFFYIPEDERAGFAVHHFSKKARKCLFDRDILKVLHAQFFPKIRKWGETAGRQLVGRKGRDVPEKWKTSPKMWIKGKALLVCTGSKP